MRLRSSALFRAAIATLCVIVLWRLFVFRTSDVSSDEAHPDEIAVSSRQLKRVASLDAWKYYGGVSRSSFYRAFTPPANDLPLPPVGAEIEVDPHMLVRRLATTHTPTYVQSPIQGVELTMSITYRIDDSKSDAQEIWRCAKQRFYNLSATNCPHLPVSPESLGMGIQGAGVGAVGARPAGGGALMAGRQTAKLTFWSQDYQAGVVNELKWLLQPMDVTFIDKSLSPHCSFFGTCGRDLRGISSLTAVELMPDTVQRFLAEYAPDWQFNSVDAFLCVRPPALCELFMPFRRSMIVVIDGRYELGRWNMERWFQWTNNLIKIATDPNNVVAATNQYDVEYVRFYTGLAPLLLPPACLHIMYSYQPDTTTNFLLYPIRMKKFEEIFVSEFEDLAKNASVHLTPMHRFRFDQSAENLVRFAGIVLVPYQVSSLRMTELYRMNVPIFAPSQELLTRWHVTHGVIVQRTWYHITRHIPESAGIRMPGRLSLPNPNDDHTLSSVGYWMQYLDIYTWRHIIYFESVADLVKKLKAYSSNGTMLAEVSNRMKAQNVEIKKDIHEKWRRILDMMHARKQGRNTASTRQTPRMGTRPSVKRYY